MQCSLFCEAADVSEQTLKLRRSSWSQVPSLYRPFPADIIRPCLPLMRCILTGSSCCFAGLAGTHAAWAYQLKDLAGTDVPNSPNSHTSSGNDITVSATKQLEEEDTVKAEKHKDSKVHASMEEEAVLEELEGLEVDDEEDDVRSSEGLSEDRAGKDNEEPSTSQSPSSGSGLRTEKSANGGGKETGASKAAAARPISTGRMCCAFDNRGVGRSTILKKKSDYK
jgi:hypothetical protein